jgi:hypothetical protein
MRGARMRFVGAILFFALVVAQPISAASQGPSAAYDKAIANMAENPRAAARALQHPATDLERLDAALFLHAFRKPSPARDREIRALLARLKADIGKQKSWAMDQLGPIPRYDGTDKSLIPIIQAASLSGVANSESAFYAIPCGVLERRPGLLDATEPQFGSNLDNFVPRDGCDWDRGAVKGFPKGTVEAYYHASDVADGFVRASPQGTIWYGIWAGQAAVKAHVMVDPRSFLKGPDAALDYPYQNWGYLSLWNHSVAQDIRAKFIHALVALRTFYESKGLSTSDASRAARNALFAVPLGASCGKQQPPAASLRTLILDGVPENWIESFVSSDHWKDASRLAPIFACAKDADIDPLVSIAIKDVAVLRLVQKAAAPLSDADRANLDLDVDANAKNAFGKTPLMTAAQFNLLDSAALLLEEGARVSDKTDTTSLYFAGRTALHYAAQSGSLAMIKLLLAHGADIKAQDVAGSAPGFTLAGEPKGGLRPLDYLEGKGPVPANARLSATDRAEAVELLMPH